MNDTSRRFASRLVLLTCLALGTSGCPLPIRHSEAVSAPVVGVFYTTDGRPAIARDVAVTVAYGDSTCARAELRTATDSAGRFRLPGVTRRHRVLWIIPNFDPLPASYRLCLGAADTLRTAYHGRGSLGAEAPRDSLTCREWAWEGRLHVACEGRYGRPITSGGRWTDGPAGGWFRLIRTETRSEKAPGGRPRVIVQWVEGSPSGPGESVRATVAIPPEEAARGIRELGDPLLVPARDGWCVSVHSRVATRWGSRRQPLVYVLGAPGQITAVSRCLPPLSSSRDEPGTAPYATSR